MANGVFSEQIVGKLSILSQTISDSDDVEVMWIEPKKLSNIVNGLIYEQIVDNPLISRQSMSDSDDVEVRRSDVNWSQVVFW